MFEMLINPREAERRPTNLFFVGLLYASLSLFLVDWIFLRDSVLSKYSSLLVVMFTTIFSLPFMYYIIRFAEIKEVLHGKGRTLFKEHGKAILPLLFLFFGFIVAFSFWYIVLPNEIVSANFNAQIEQYCAINSPSEIQNCLKESTSGITGNVISGFDNTYAIFLNNIYVLIFVLIFSLAFGAGAIFILVWNAGVIATAIGLIIRNSTGSISNLIGYSIHGIPEIAAYFIAALAGGILSVAVIRRDFRSERAFDMALDFVSLIAIALIVLLIAAFLEVFISPSFF
ncbi:stage II sporulation protein M [Candidatus Pacearchaeota archaeon]|nr:stage II sporulation protein M [Candidatus Pacearchaeota archaeon]